MFSPREENARYSKCAATIEDITSIIYFPYGVTRRARQAERDRSRESDKIMRRDPDAFGKITTFTV